MHDHTTASPDGIPFPELAKLVAAAERHFSRIREKFPTLKGYLTLSLPGGQTAVGNSLRNMLSEFPPLFIHGAAKTKALALIQKLRSLEKKKESAEAKHLPKLNQQIGILNDSLHDLSPDLLLDSNCRFEIRFHHLDYDLIWELQTDEMVDRALTPQTKASIRIVLGTLTHTFPS